MWPGPSQRKGIVASPFLLPPSQGLVAVQRGEFGLWGPILTKLPPENESPHHHSFQKYFLMTFFMIILHTILKHSTHFSNLILEQGMKNRNS